MGQKTNAPNHVTGHFDELAKIISLRAAEQANTPTAGPTAHGREAADYHQPALSSELKTRKLPGRRSWTK